MTRRATFLLSFIIIAAAKPAGADEGPALGKASGERLLDDALERVHRRFWDKKKAATIDWGGLTERYREAARKSESSREGRSVVNRALGELKTSHLALIPGTVYDRELGAEFEAKRTTRAGCELVLEDGRLHLSGVAEDGPAEEAGLATGDEVLEIDGLPAKRSPRLEDAGHDPGLPGPPSFSLGVSAGDRVRLLVRRRRDERPRTAELVPRETSLVDSTRASVRVFQRDGRRLGRIHLWHFQHGRIPEILEDALEGPFSHVDGLVLDVRGRGGHSWIIQRVLSSFRGERPLFRRPVVALIDRGTRSAKEVFAWSFRRSSLGKLVGERTTGAVIGCAFERLFDGSVLMLPVSDVKNMTRGEQLEGNGVAPDVEVDPGPLPYRAGADRIGDRGEAVLLERLGELPPHRWY